MTVQTDSPTSRRFELGSFCMRRASSNSPTSPLLLVPQFCYEDHLNGGRLRHRVRGAPFTVILRDGSMRSLLEHPTLASGAGGGSGGTGQGRRVIVTPAARGPQSRHGSGRDRPPR
jgi:hypothetical protein